jgi:toxin YoeB
MFRAEYTEKFNRGYEKLYESNLEKIGKINRLRDDILEHPRSGIGRPERLRHFHGEVWFRRIDYKNRLVYKIFDNNIILFDSCIGHYGDR